MPIIFELNNGSNAWSNSLWAYTSNQIEPGSMERSRNVETGTISEKLQRDTQRTYFQIPPFLF
jgi:hypothetical protein